MARFLGVDASTKKFAWAIVNDGELEEYGEIFFRETVFHKRLSEARKQVEDLLPLLGTVDYIAFERAVMVRSTDTAIKMAEMFGVILSVLVDLKSKLVETSPVAWQSWAGNPVISGKKKLELLDQHPELKSKSQQQTFIRQYRKQKTIDFVEKETGVKMVNDDLGDAACIALFIQSKVEDINAKS